MYVAVTNPVYCQTTLTLRCAAYNTEQKSIRDSGTMAACGARSVSSPEVEASASAIRLFQRHLRQELTK